MFELTYQQWALIADLYTPVLIISSVFLLISASPQLRICCVKAQLFCIALVYGSMMMDEWLSIWPSFSADYSTHTAIALVFVVHITLKGPRLGQVIAVISLLAYMQLMHHQGYHTYLDMISTLIYLLPMLLVTWSAFRKAD
ncbi:hypothetical protein [Vibrio rarus]|uniref:hypothetical protein n=1 Tax=Vibrio rarus TaxID=413403 RepID=UPI0021C43A46|nr:hypothetical protein [Vibrio rarus]